MDTISYLLGQVHDCIQKMEQIYYLKNVSTDIMSCTNEINHNLDESVTNYDNIKKQLQDILENTTD